MIEKKKQLERQLATIKNFKETFSGVAGKRVLREMMRRFGFLNTTVVSNDPYQTYFNEGQRAVVVYICNQIKLDISGLEAELMKGDDDGF